MTPQENQDLLDAYLGDLKPQFRSDHGAWSPAWDFYFTSQNPPKGLVATVFGVVTDRNGKVLLASNEKQSRWELPGGHLTQREIDRHDLIGGFRRELQEETDMPPSDLFGVELIGVGHIKGDGSINRETGKPYPFPNSLMAFFEVRAAHMLRTEKAEYWTRNEAKMMLNLYCGNGRVLDYLKTETIP